MGADRFNNVLRPLKPGDRLREALNADRLNALATLAQEAAAGRHLRGGPGMLVSTGAAGSSLRARRRLPRPMVTIHPFWIYDDTGLMHAGTVNGTIIPLLGGDPIGEEGNTLTIAGLDRYIYIKVVFTLVFEYFLLKSYAIKEVSEVKQVTIETETSPKSDALVMETNELTAYKLVAQVVDGVVQRQQATASNLNLSVCDYSTGEDGGQAVQAFWVPA